MGARSHAQVSPKYIGYCVKPLFTIAAYPLVAVSKLSLARELIDWRMSELLQRSGLKDRRLVFRVLHRVTRGTADRRLPRLEDVDPWFIGDDWVNCAVVCVMQPYSQSEFMLVGSNLCQPGSVLDGEAISTCPATTLLGLTLFYFEQAVEERSFLVIEGAAPHLDGPILYRSLLVPLSEDDKKVDAVLIAANSRACRQGEYEGPATRLVWSHGFGVHRH